MIRATVVICTHNRAAVVGRAVAGARCRGARDDAEVLVVDNASTRRHAGRAGRARRATRAGAAPRRARAGARPVGGTQSRPRRGARRGRRLPRRRRRCRGPAGSARCSRRTTIARVACVGGRIVLRFPGRRRRGSRRRCTRRSAPTTSARRRGGCATGPTTYPFGANISFRAADGARAPAASRTTVGPLGRHQLVHDETDLCFRLDQAGGEIRYAPGRRRRPPRACPSA